MPKVQYKKNKGALHIGGGRFFYAGEPVMLDGGEAEDLLSKHKDLELVEEEDTTSYTKTALKKLNADQQKEIIVGFGGDPETTSNEDERIDVILQLQAAGE